MHTIDYYKELAAKMQEMGADSICVKDMAGILTPARGIRLVNIAKRSDYGFNRSAYTLHKRYCTTSLSSSH